MEPSCSNWGTFTELQQEQALTLATLIMWAATGRQFGPCELTVRPCQSWQIAQSYRAYPVRGFAGQAGLGLPYLYAGRWFNCGCGGGCCCRPDCEIILPGPVTSIIEVTIGDEVVPATDYRVDAAEGAYRLVKLTEGCWPTCQDMNVESGELGSFTVVYGRGWGVPQAVLNATGMLACSLVPDIAAGTDCALPGRMSSLTRQGVTADFVVEQVDLDDFETGIPNVDRVIRAVNPSRRFSPPRVYSIDAVERRDRRTVIPRGV